MVSSRTIIGTVVGGIITAIGIFSLITTFGVQEVSFNDTYPPGDGTTYRFTAPEHSKQWINITGESFHLDLRSPRGGLQIDEQDYKNELSIEWVHLEDGESILKLTNTGSSDLNADGLFVVLTEPIQTTYHILVITAGVVIIGFSAGFSIRKPKGF